MCQVITITVHITGQLAKIAAGTATLAIANSAFALDIKLSEDSGNTLTAEFSEVVHNYNVFTLDEPERVVIDIDDASAISGLSVSRGEQSSILNEVRSGVVDNNQSRVVFDISENHKIQEIDWWKEENLMRLMVIAHHKNSCTPSVTNFNICDKAREISEQMSKELPMRITKNLVLSSALPSKNSINLVAMLSYKPEDLERIGSAQGVSIEEMKNKNTTYAHNMTCDEEIGMKPFIELGGIMRTHYRYNDGTKFMTVEVDSCE